MKTLTTTKILLASMFLAGSVSAIGQDGGTSGSGTMGSRGDMSASSGSSTRTARADRN